MIEGFILIGTSDGFRNEGLIREKLDLYLSRMPEADVLLLNDVSRLLSKYFGGRELDSLSPYMPLREKRRLVSKASGFIFFWDGASIVDFIHMSSISGKPVKTIFVETTRVVNKDRGDEFDIYIGRGTPWGNPFAIGQDGMDRRQVISAYRDYFKKRFIDDPQGNRDILTLRGKVLGCHCKPELCHGDVIADYLNSLDETGAD